MPEITKSIGQEGAVRSGGTLRVLVERNPSGFEFVTRVPSSHGERQMIMAADAGASVAWQRLGTPSLRVEIRGLVCEDDTTPVDVAEAMFVAVCEGLGRTQEAHPKPSARDYGFSSDA
jgi:hypothetical protein